MNTQVNIFEKLFKTPFNDDSNKIMLEQIIKDYPYFVPAHFFLSKQMNEQDINYQDQIATTSLLFNNPHWLSFQLNQKNNLESSTNIKEDNRIKEVVSGSIEISKPIEFKIQTPTEEKLTFEPLFATDYFASQGIKLNEDAEPTDKLGKQLKSFTDWLKTMKKKHIETPTSIDEGTDITIQKLAEKSNTDEKIVTEAMAEVFIKQNKAHKAIDVYEKLSLLNPSKSAYFAAKIEQLKAI